MELEQPAHQLVPIWDAQVEGCGFTSSAVTLFSKTGILQGISDGSGRWWRWSWSPLWLSSVILTLTCTLQPSIIISHPCPSFPSGSAFWPAGTRTDFNSDPRGQCLLEPMCVLDVTELPCTSLVKGHPRAKDNFKMRSS